MELVFCMPACCCCCCCFVRTIVFLSVRQKQGTRSGSHMGNTNQITENTLFKTGGHTTRVVGFTYVSLAFWSSRERRKTGCEMLSQMGEEKDYQDTEAESGWPTGAPLWQLDWPTADSLLEQPLPPHGRYVMAQRCLTCRDIYTLCQTTQTPFPNFSPALSTKKIARSLAQTKPSVFWPAIGGYITVLGLQRKTCTRHSGSSYQELGRIEELPFPLEFNMGKTFYAFTFSFSAFSSSVHTHVKASRSNCALSNTRWSDFSGLFFLLS